MNTIWKNNRFAISGDLTATSQEFLQAGQVKLLAKLPFNLLRSLRESIDKIEIHDPEIARFLSNVIPAQCPFERDIILFGRKLGHIPPLCKLNPFYEQLVSLRFRALCFLAEQCGEDVRSYCS
jgi:hypothetical protein